MNFNEIDFSIASSPIMGSPLLSKHFEASDVLGEKILNYDGDAECCAYCVIYCSGIPLAAEQNSLMQVCP